MCADFRRVLKNETQADHERVDALISSIDLVTFDGLVRFLSIHQSCFRFIRDLVTTETHAWCSLDGMVRRIDADLATMGAAETVVVVSDITKLDRLAIDYVIEGSRLGSKVLRRRWLTASDPTVRRASAYFSLAAVPGRWRNVCDQLSKIPVQSDRAGAIIEDTKMLFALFHAAACEPVAEQLQGVQLAS
ncbi:biliverdin-producing heme oxygenase [uncultured Roseobacter sp.]|uniref:biliverdin-producing heme oxygenase n=1 Tax=uncultured Roseobacter sp. TaxID=114847 RepID=UPI002618348A|nr:biliverdin-producing heme oxygenase [uncultured Roseobacter sp.]